MKLYDFSLYAKRREAQRAADRIEALKEKLNEPGSIQELKQEMNDWLLLHKAVTKSISS